MHEQRVGQQILDDIHERKRSFSKREMMIFRSYRNTKPGGKKHTFSLASYKHLLTES